MSHMQPIAENLFTDEPSLIGSKCMNCAEVFFPTSSSCSNCSTETMQAVDLGNTGVLWSWTVQHFQPKPPYNSGETSETFKPFGIGFVELSCGIKIKTRLKSEDISSFCIGDKMSLVITTFRKNESGHISTFEFQKEGL